MTKHFEGKNIHLGRFLEPFESFASKSLITFVACQKKVR